MKKIFLLPVLCKAFHPGQAQTAVSNVSNAGGDHSNFLFGNTSAASNTYDPRGMIWLNNDGKFKLRSVTWYGFALRDVSNTWDMLNVDNNGYMGIAIAAGSQKLVVNGNMKLVFEDNFPAKNTDSVVALGYSDITGAENWALRGVDQYSNGISDLMEGTWI